MIGLTTVLRVLVWWNGTLAVSAAARRIVMRTLAEGLLRIRCEPQEWAQADRHGKREYEERVMQDMGPVNCVCYILLKVLATPWRIMTRLADMSSAPVAVMGEMPDDGENGPDDGNPPAGR